MMCAADAKTEPLSANYRTVAVLMGPVSETAASDIIVVVVVVAAAAVRIPTTRGMASLIFCCAPAVGTRWARQRPRALFREAPYLRLRRAPALKPVQKVEIAAAPFFLPPFCRRLPPFAAIVGVGPLRNDKSKGNF